MGTSKLHIIILFLLPYSNVTVTHAQSYHHNTYQRASQTVEGDSILELAVIADASSGPAVLKVTFTAQASGGRDILTSGILTDPMGSESMASVRK